MKHIAVLLSLFALSACAPNPLQPVEGNDGNLAMKPAKSCKVAGCSSQLCVDANGPDVASTCEWTQAYACYQQAKCEVQADGACGWTQTHALQLCLEEAKIYRP